MPSMEGILFKDESEFIEKSSAPDILPSSTIRKDASHLAFLSEYFVKSEVSTVLAAPSTPIKEREVFELNKFPNIL